MARRRKARRKSKSMWKTVKGVVYLGSIAAPAYANYVAGGEGKNGVITIFQKAGFVDPATGSFSFEAGASQWTPVAAVALVDFATSRIGLQRKVAQGVNGILG